MRFISTSVHGILDYLMGMILILVPWMLQFADEGPATYIPVGVGAMLILYSLFTDYELGVVGAISMKTHLWLDGLFGIFLAASPWIFNFNTYIYVPHLVFGIAEFLAAVCTRTVPLLRAKVDVDVNNKNKPGIHGNAVNANNPNPGAGRTDRPYIRVTGSDIDPDVHTHKKAS